MSTYAMKPRFVWSAFLLCSLMAIALISKEGDPPSPIHGESDYTITLNAANAPTTSSTYTDTLQTVRYTEFAYGDVKASEGNHVEMSSNAWIRNNYQITSITGITVTFSGDGYLDISVSYDTSNYFEYPLTSGVRKDFANLPYYFQLMSCNAPVIIESIVLTYSCVDHPETLDKYEISWYDEDGMTLLEKDVDVEPGTMPSYDGPTPTKPYDPGEGTFFTFAGWDWPLEPVSGNFSYFATYTPYMATYSLITEGTAYELTSVSDNTMVRISIPSSYEGLPVTSIAAEVFDGFTSLEAVDLPSTLVTIGDGAFAGCTSLTTIHLPASLGSFGQLPFVGDSSLTSITVDEANTHFSSLDGVLFNETQDTLLIYPDGKGTSYSIPSGVTTVAEGAFFHATLLESVTISPSVTTLGSSVFGFCSSLDNVVIPNTVTNLGVSTFVYCTGLTSVTLPSGLTTLPSSTFQGCSSLGSVTLPSGITTIDMDAFYNCSSLTSLTLPSGLTTIGTRAFAYCSLLGNMTLPEGLVTINGNAFLGCTTMTSITIPSTVTSIGAFVFVGCSSLTEIVVASANANYASLAGVLFNKDFTTLINYPTGKADATYAIPSGVVSILNNAFRDNLSLAAVSIPSSVTSILEYSFRSCLNLTLTIDPANTAYAIVDGVLFTEDMTTLVMFPSGKSDASYTVPSSVTTIQGNAFRDISTLTSVIIPSSVTTIGYHGFYLCNNLTINCVASAKPAAWNTDWNASSRPVVWGYVA